MNPYEVLGVSPNDDEETIKKAYRSLVKKYHPDRYANSPLAEQANEKLKEINLAYDIITGKAQNTTQSQGGYSYGGYNTAGLEASFDNARRLISMHMLDAAEQMLAKLARNAEWYYLMGVIYLRRGWYDRARDFINRACALDPGNSEYRSAQEGFSSRGGTFRSYGANLSPLACCAASVCCSRVCCGGRAVPCLCFC